MALAGTVLEYQDSQRAVANLLEAIASPFARLRVAWKRRAGRRGLARSIAHLDDRLLTDIGLGPNDLGLAERIARSRAVQSARLTDWQ
jgi:uncharacterized protein YjiS (DUF1127 family)